MNSKDIKKYNLIASIISSHPREEALADMVAELAAIDFSVAFEVWEYVLTAYQKELSDMETAENLEARVFETLYSMSENKTRQLFCDSLPLNRLVYGNCVTSCAGANLKFIASLILSTKLDAAEEALKCVRSNSVEGFDYGERLKDVLDKVFAIYCDSKGVKKVELSRKQSSLLLDFIGKVKGPNKKLLEQRIKEL